jgi:glycosyltransferase involved in cell wall biosynthesis
VLEQWGQLNNMTLDAAVERTRPTVMLVSVGFAYGGAESYYVKLARILLAEYRIVAVVCSQRLADELRGLGIEAECAGPTTGPSSLRRYLFAVKACRRMVLRNRPTVAHLNGQPESYLAVFLRLMGLRLLTTRHTPFTDLYLQEGSRLPVALKRWMVLFSLRFSQRTICVSQLLRQQLVQYLPEDQLAFIPTWVADEFLGSYQRPSPSTPLKVLFVGRVVRNKGIFDAIEAVRRCPQAHLTVVGEGDELEAAQELASGLGVTFAGFQRDCKPIYRASDLLIFASPEGFEGLPQVPLEAMAMGLPCLASDISSIREIDGEDGALAIYRQGDIDDLVEKLSGFSGNNTALIELGQAGRREIERRFTESTVSGAYLDQFRLAMQ